MVRYRWNQHSPAINKMVLMNLLPRTRALALFTCLIVQSTWAMSARSEALHTMIVPKPADSGQHTAVHCMRPSHPSSEAVLFVHGASFPTRLAAAFEFKSGDSWLSFVASRGFLACGLDFSGFGASTRPDEMAATPAGRTPLGRAPQAADEISQAVTSLRREFHTRSVHVVAHSWGTIPAARFAADHPHDLATLVLFGPIVAREQAASAPVNTSWWSIRPKARYEQLRFKDTLPADLDLLEPAVHERWASEFARSGPNPSATVNDELRIPAGPLADIEAAHRGNFPYAASKVSVPVMVIYGDYDTETDDRDAEVFLKGFTASPLRWRVRLDHGTHVMHLETNRRSLYEAVQAFIAASSASSARR